MGGALRTNLTRHCLKEYFEANAFYTLRELDGRIKDPEQRYLLEYKNQLFLLSSPPLCLPLFALNSPQEGPDAKDRKRRRGSVRNHRQILHRGDHAHADNHRVRLGPGRSHRL